MDCSGPNAMSFGDGGITKASFSVVRRRSFIVEEPQHVPNVLTQGISRSMLESIVSMVKENFCMLVKPVWVRKPHSSLALRRIAGVTFLDDGIPSHGLAGKIAMQMCKFKVALLNLRQSLLLSSTLGSTRNPVRFRVHNRYSKCRMTKLRVTSKRNWRGSKRRWTH